MLWFGSSCLTHIELALAIESPFFFLLCRPEIRNQIILEGAGQLLIIIITGSLV